MEYDPYTDDNIFSDQRMIDNLNDIISFKVEHKDKVILQQYYPTISHKTAGRIIRDIEIQSEINQKDEK